jgi:uncharacterized protein YukE
MRAEAATLRTRAARLDALASEVDGRVRATEFEGPAANAFRSVMTRRRGRVERAASELVQLSRQLDAQAASVEEEIRRRRALEAR